MLESCTSDGASAQTSSIDLAYHARAVVALGWQDLGWGMNLPLAAGFGITCDDCAASCPMSINQPLRPQPFGFGKERLLFPSSGRVITLDNGYMPLLVNFTIADKAAKGLRKRGSEDLPEKPVYFSALELLRDNQILFLRGPSGSGKTTFAKYVALQLSRQSLRPQAVFRNEEALIRDESWAVKDVFTVYILTKDEESLEIWEDSTLPQLLAMSIVAGGQTDLNLLIIIDAVEKAKSNGPVILERIATVVLKYDNVKLLILGDTDRIKLWVLPSTITCHELLPFLKVQRHQAIKSLVDSEHSQLVGMGAAAANPVCFALAVEANNPGNQAERLLDAWLDVVAPSTVAADMISARACERLEDRSLDVLPDSIQFSSSSIVSCSAVQELLAARHLAKLPLENAVALFLADPWEMESTMRSLLQRLKDDGKEQKLIRALITSRLGALLVADFLVDSALHQKQISDQMLAIIKKDFLPLVQREKAGRILSRLGDPRDLEAFVDVPMGPFVFGSETFANSTPLQTLTIKEFRIGIYPVTNLQYFGFVQDTGRQWNSPDRLILERQTAPATHLSWHDASSYCEWLTSQWRLTNKIGFGEQVRLPTEPEWERAARGDLTGDGPVYPWGAGWQPNSANFEGSGLNTTCAVGLFSRGRSPYGCYDMAGNVWEWCTTIWGDDMSLPAFRYPWREDGRESLKAPSAMRRVLRGGCFSSEREKASCTYRGSLEPEGSWRGNGFRIVIAPILP